MSDYIVSARKYRPDTFETLIGQDNIAKTLKNSIVRGKLAHAYLFCGPRGVGKTSTARIFAKTINCSNPGPDMEPCGECESCRSFAEGRSYCIRELDAASNNGVDDIKALMDQVQMPPQVGRYSVYIIDEVHMLSTSAFNAFLKTLEEPPAHAIFILATTEKHKILPTILSRCQTYDFSRISVGDMVRNLRAIAAKEGITIDDESLHIIAGKADGAMRDALTIFDQTVAFCGTDVHSGDVMKNLNVLGYEYHFRLVDAFLAGDYASAMLTFDEILAKGFNSQHFLSALGSHFRDLMVCGTAGLESLLDMPDSLRQRYAAQAAACSSGFLFRALGIVTACEASYKSSLNQRLHIEFALMQLSFLNGGVPASAPTVAPSVSARVSAPAPEPVHAPSAKTVETPVSEAAAPKAAEQKTPVPESPSAAEDVKSVAETAKPEARTPRARRGAVNTGASVSLNAMLNEDKEEKIDSAEEQAEAVDINTEQLAAAWKQLSDKQQKPRLKSALALAKVDLLAGEGYQIVEFEVSNEAQRKWIEENLLRELETDFRKFCGNPLVRLQVRVAETLEVQKAYLPREKAEELMAKHEEVRMLIKDFGLDTK